MAGLTPRHHQKRFDVERELKKARRKIERREDRLARHRKVSSPPPTIAPRR
jgi:hypothetical protein